MCPLQPWGCAHVPTGAPGSLWGSLTSPVHVSPPGLLSARGCHPTVSPRAGVRVPMRGRGDPRDTGDAAKTHVCPGRVTGVVAVSRCVPRVPLCPLGSVPGPRGVPAARPRPGDPPGPPTVYTLGLFSGSAGIFGFPMRSWLGTGRAGVTCRDTRSRGLRPLSPRGIAQVGSGPSCCIRPAPAAPRRESAPDTWGRTVSPAATGLAGHRLWPPRGTLVTRGAAVRGLGGSRRAPGVGVPSFRKG